MEKQNVAGVMPAQRTFLSIRQLTVAGFCRPLRFFRPYGLWLHSAGHHECDDPSYSDDYRQPDGRPQGRHDCRLHVWHFFFYPVFTGAKCLALVRRSV